MEPRGLILVVGATGSGKSTTLAAMIDHRNTHKPGHILTIEDPIEYLHRHKKSIVNQREVGLDTHSYHEALSNAMREAPDVIMIGEIRDTDTMEAAIVVLRDRPPVPGHAAFQQRRPDAGAHPQLLPRVGAQEHPDEPGPEPEAVISQRLVVGKDGRRFPAVEVLLNTPLIRDMIRRGQIHEVKEAMDRSLQDGMQHLRPVAVPAVQGRPDRAGGGAVQGRFARRPGAEDPLGRRRLGRSIGRRQRSLRDGAVKAGIQK